jgi:hypothetical protein
MGRPATDEEALEINKMLDALESGEDVFCSLCGTATPPNEINWYPTVPGNPAVCSPCKARLEAEGTGSSKGGEG